MGKNQWLRKLWNCLQMILNATPFDEKSSTLSSMPVNARKVLLVNNIHSANISTENVTGSFKAFWCLQHYFNNITR